MGLGTGLCMGLGTGLCMGLGTGPGMGLGTGSGMGLGTGSGMGLSMGSACDEGRPGGGTALAALGNQSVLGFFLAADLEAASSLAASAW
jgi:hypothetical protein